MKCVCPMGGDRTCPDNCIIAVWHKLPDDQKTKERRLPLVKTLAEQEYPQDAIARQIGVNQRTVGRDLETLGIMPNVKGKGKDTRGRKKSTGRPKGSTNKPKPRPGRGRASENSKLTREQEDIIGRVVLDEGGTHAEAARQAGIEIDPSHHGDLTIRFAIARQEGRREERAEPAIDKLELSLTAQQKFDIALRQATRRLEHEINQRLHAEYQRWLADLIADYRKKEKHYNIIVNQHKGVMSKTTYNLIWSCLHPDSRASTSDEKLNRAFHEWSKLENALVSAKESGTKYSDLPQTAAELLKRKEEYQARKAAERAAKRANKSMVQA